MISVKKIVELTGGRLISGAKDQIVSTFFLDSRKPVLAKSACFIAISGKNHDGHYYINDLIDKGVGIFIVEKEVELKSNQIIIRVINSKDAFQKIASYHRSRFNFPVVGITGSNGKSIVKELIGQLLIGEKRLVRSPKSFNSQIGVPLSVLQMEESHEVACFEAGISEPTEMKKLERVIKPTLGVFTNIGSAHDEGFSSRIDKAKEKLHLFSNAEKLVICHDHQIIREISISQKLNLIQWSFKKTSLDYFCEIEKLNTSSILKINDTAFSIPFLNDQMIENAIHAIIVCIELGISTETIQSKTSDMHPPKMRLEILDGDNGVKIIDDSYSNDMVGLEIAINFLVRNSFDLPKAIILSDLGHGKELDQVEKQKIETHILDSGIEKIILVGDKIKDLKIGIPSLKFRNEKECLTFLSQNPISNHAVLIKGARKFKFEQLVEFLKKKIHGTFLEIDLDALTHNLNFYRSKLRPNTKLMVMVKALAYGAGMEEVAQLLQFQKVDYLAVAYADEGVELRKSGVTLPIMVMNTQASELFLIRKYNLEPVIFSISLLDKIIESNESWRFHLKIDSGMHRLGFVKEQIDEVLNKINDGSNFKIKSVFSHLVGTDEKQLDDFTNNQCKYFQEIVEKISSSVDQFFITHICNSAGIIRFPQYHFDMVRLGLGLYGIDGSKTIQNSLRQVAVIKSHISQIHQVKKGESVGYSRAEILDHDAQIATVAIGYGDGYDRRFSKGIGMMEVNGKLANVIGNVCMDMTMIDITGINANEGDEVIIFSDQAPVWQQAKAIDTIPYEILTNIGNRIRRVYKSEEN